MWYSSGRLLGGVGMDESERATARCAISESGVTQRSGGGAEWSGRQRGLIARGARARHESDRTLSARLRGCLFSDRLRSHLQAPPGPLPTGRSASEVP